MHQNTIQLIEFDLMKNTRNIFSKCNYLIQNLKNDFSLSTRNPLS